MKTRRRAAVVALVAVCGLLASCVANPGPPPIETGQEAESSAADVAGAHGRSGDGHSAEPEDAAQANRPGEVNGRKVSPHSASKVGVGIDPIHFGLNPHVQANQQAVVDDIAALVLPSAFRGDEITELLESAEEIPVPEAAEVQASDLDAASDFANTADSPVVQRVRYTIAPQAQWSDGTPITGEDFIYLWDKMITTPGVVGAAGYFAISEISSSAGGRIVDVDFSQRVADWQGLFRYLLPAHLMNTPFASARELPAGAGRYQIDSIDWGRGKVTLHRNDRYWGADPASIDVVELTEIRSPAQGLDLLRSGQLSFADITPQETTFAAYSALPGTEVFRFNTPRQLRIDLTTRSSIFASPEARAEFMSSLNIPELAVFASGRRTDVRIPGFSDDAAQAVGSASVSTPQSTAPQGSTNNDEISNENDVALLDAETSAARPLRIAADPADTVASAAAAFVVDRMVTLGVHAEVVADGFATISSDLVPAGEVDAVISWDDTSSSALAIADDLLCRAPESSTAQASWLPHCLPNHADLWTEVLSGEIDQAGGQQLVENLREEHALFVPLIDERRIRALGRGIIGPNEGLETWPAGLKTVPQWKLTGKDAMTNVPE